MTTLCSNITYWNIFDITCKKYPDNSAVIIKNSKQYETFSYKKLFKVSCILYDEIKDLVDECECIGVFMKHDAYLPSILAAIHRSRCCFAFIDPEADFATNIKMIKDFQITKVFSKTKDICFEGFTVTDMKQLSNKQINLYLFQSQNYDRSCTIWKACENFVAYCIKTSGSTSIQKNVVVSHNSIFPNVVDLSAIFNIQQNDVIYFSTPLTFDPSMIELYLAAYTGATLLICQDNIEALCRNNLNISPTVWQTTPSLFMKIGYDNIKTCILNENSKLRILALGGEPFNFEKLFKLKHQKNKTNVYNLYGITEVSCWASVCHVNTSPTFDEVSIGELLSNTFIRIVSDDGTEILEGCGAIEIGSAQRKCLVTTNQPDVEKMNIFHNENIMWQVTGDVGERKRDRRIYFRGRADRLIKRYGHKVNLLEIENLVSCFTEIQQAACVWLPKYHSICLIVAAEDNNVKPKLHHFLLQKLNSHSLPDVICVVREIPLSSHGKIALSKAYDLYKSRIKTEDIMTDECFINIFRENLNHSLQFEDVKEKSFLDIGGNSIIAMQIVNKIETLANINVPEVFTRFMNSKCSLQEIFNYVMKYLNETNVDINLISWVNDNNKSHDKVGAILKKKLSNTSQDTKRIALSPSSSSDITKKIKVKWKVNLDKCIDASPVLYRDCNDREYVLVGSHSGKVAMVEASSGVVSHLWEVNSRVEAPVLCVRNESPVSIVGAYDGNVWCWSLYEPFETVWKVPLQAMIKSQACYLKSDVFVATYAGVIWEIDVKSGLIISSISIEDESVSADLIISGHNIFTATLRGSCGCVTVSLDGMKTKWKTKLSSPVFAKPTLIKNDTQVLFCEAKGIVHCLDSFTGDKMWNFSATQGPVFSSCLPYATSDGEFITFGCHDQHSYYIQLIDEHNIALNGKLNHSSQIFATPCVYNTCYIICISTKGQLQLINMQSRQVVGEFILPGEVFSSGVTSGHDVYIGCRDNYLYCLSVA